MSGDFQRPYLNPLESIWPENFELLVPATLRSFGVKNMSKLELLFVTHYQPNKVFHNKIITPLNLWNLINQLKNFFLKTRCIYGEISDFVKEILIHYVQE